MNRKPWLVILFLAPLLACGLFEEEFQESEDDEQTSIFADGDAEFTDDDDPARPPAAPDQDFESAECPFDAPAGYDIECGYLRVPENRTLANSRDIDIAYAIVYAAQDEGRAPLIYLAGGPGGSAIDDFLADLEGWDYPFTRSRDLILIDQRGTGYSWPTLDCPELAEAYDLADDNPEMVCQQRLVDEGVDLTAYNTAENAADVETLRRELGIDSWDLLGISYGTRLALAVMGSYPDGVRSAVLDSVFPPNADTPGEEALAPLWSLQRLFDECAADQYCADNYPGLEARFLDAVASMNDSPLDGVFGDDLLFQVTAALNDSELIPFVPYVIYEVSEGNLDALDEIATDDVSFERPRFQDDADRSDSEGMYNSVICHDEYIFGDYASAEARLVAEAPDELEAGLLQPVFDLFQMCGWWGAGRGTASENDPVFSDIPTLILAGQYDHATPVSWAYLTAQTLTDVYVYEFPGAGHSILSGQTCAIDITAAFLDDPGQEPDAGCVDQIEWPYFE